MSDEICEDGAMTIKQFTELYGVKKSYTYILISRGHLTAKKSGRMTLISRASARAWFDALPSFKEAPWAIAAQNRQR